MILLLNIKLDVFMVSIDVIDDLMEATSMLPTVKQLKYLIALDDFRHFGKAAESSFISQSAFSIAIKELETTLGVQLVERSNKSVMITAAGQAVISRARICINDIESLMDIALSGQEPLSGRLTLGVIPTIAPYLLPDFITAVSRRYPKLQLYLREEKTALLHEQLLEGKIDLMLVALPFDLRNVSTMPLFTDPFLLACSKSSKWLSGGDKAPDIESLPDESVLLLEDGHCLRDHALSACRMRDSDKVSRFAATSLQTLLQMVSADLGLTFLPAMAAQSLSSAEGGLQLFPLPVQSCRDIGLAWRNTSSRAEEFTLLGDLLKELHQTGI